MFKRNLWIVALVAALAMVFIGCGEDRPTITFEWDKQVLEITAKDNWAGLDLVGFAGSINGQPWAGETFDFAEGDKIEISGMVMRGGPRVLLNIKHDGWKPLNDWNDAQKRGELFSETLTITAQEVTDIQTADPKNIRVRMNDAGVFVIEQLKITRGTTVLLDLSEYLQTLDINESDPDVIFDADMGLVPGGGPSNVSFRVIGPGADEAEPCCTDCDVDNCDDCVDFKCVDDCYDADTNPDGECCIPVLHNGTNFKINVGGTEQAKTLTATGGTVAYFDDATGYYFKNTTGWQGAWSKFTVDFGASGNITQYEKVTFKMEGIGGDCNYKSVSLLAAPSLTATWGSSNPIGTAVNISNSVQYADGERNITLTIDQSKVSALTGQTLEISIYHHSANGAAYEYSNIVFVKGEICDECEKYPCECACDECGEQECECEWEETDELTVSVLTGIGVIDAASYALIEAAKPRSYVLLVLESAATDESDKSQWGLGHFGNANITAPGTYGSGVFAYGETAEFIIPIADIASENINLQNGANFVSAKLFQPFPPAP